MRASAACRCTSLLAPAIEYARTGFPVTEVIAAAWSADAEAIHDSPGFAAVFLPRGRVPEAGETFVNAPLASAYELLATEGRDAFYRGPIGGALADHLQTHGGFVAREDLAAHRSDWVEPVSSTYRGWHVYELPPNGQGIAVLQMLNILEGFDVSSLRWGSAEHLHLSSRRRSSRSRIAHVSTPIPNLLAGPSKRSSRRATPRRAERCSTPIVL